MRLSPHQRAALAHLGAGLLERVSWGWSPRICPRGEKPRRVSGQCANSLIRLGLAEHASSVTLRITDAGRAELRRKAVELRGAKNRRTRCRA